MKLRKPLAHPPHLYEMAKGLNLERRLHPRVKVPVQSWEDFTGPRVVLNQEVFPLHDLSEGGICLVDNSDSFALKMGEEMSLTIECGSRFIIPCRMVAMNLTRRHIQFIKPAPSLKMALREWVQSGLRGQWLKVTNISLSHKNHPILWSSIYDDSLTFSSDPRWQYNFCIDGEVFHLSSELWPVSAEDLKPITVEKFDRLLTCLENLSFSDETSNHIKQFLFLQRRRSFE